MLGRLPVAGKEETQLWIRAFKLEPHIQMAVDLLNAKTERKWCFCPLIYEYEAGEAFFHIMIGARLDQLGLIDGHGFIWITRGKEHKEEARKARDKFADEVLEKMKTSGKRVDEVIEIDTGREV